MTVRFVQENLQNREKWNFLQGVWGERIPLSKGMLLFW